MANHEFEPTRARRLLRTIRVSVASVAVIALGGALALGPTRPVLSTTVSESYVGGHRQVLYGSVLEANGDPIAGAVVRLFHSEDGRRIWDARTTTADDGTYRKILHLDPGKFRIVIRLPDRMRARRVIKLRDGWAVKVSAEVSEGGQLLFLPIVHY